MKLLGHRAWWPARPPVPLDPHELRVDIAVVPVK
jgi:hypothetical protein